MDGLHEQDAGRQAGAGRLGALLQDLAHTHGKVQAAELLGVNYRTLARCLESGELTARRCGRRVHHGDPIRHRGELPAQTDGAALGSRQAVGRFDERLVNDAVTCTASGSPQPDAPTRILSTGSP